ncbi:MAG: hypothetical protein HUU41_14735 [Bryobacteraceae bacterium]|nr:hypothetical protein [Bryobacteraceae bacterium]
MFAVYADFTEIAEFYQVVSITWSATYQVISFVEIPSGIAEWWQSGPGGVQGGSLQTAIHAEYYL